MTRHLAMFYFPTNPCINFEVQLNTKQLVWIQHSKIVLLEHICLYIYKNLS